MSLSLHPQMLHHAVEALKQGELIAYPTEGVYGLGCDPFNEAAVRRLIALKQRDPEQGLILIAARWEQIEALISDCPEKVLNTMKKSWPGPLTWVVPASVNVPAWITGKYSSVALRLTDHPQALALCDAYGGPIVSTSANVHGEPAAYDNIDVLKRFSGKVAYVLPGRVADPGKASEIRDALSGNVLRARK